MNTAILRGPELKLLGEYIADNLVRATATNDRGLEVRFDDDIYELRIAVNDYSVKLQINGGPWTAPLATRST